MRLDALGRGERLRQLEPWRGARGRFDDQRGKTTAIAKDVVRHQEQRNAHGHEQSPR